MERPDLENLLLSVRDGQMPVEDALQALKHFPQRDLGHTQLDTQRALRCGQAEVIFGAGKSPAQLRDITRAALEHHTRVLATRVDAEGAAAILEVAPDATHSELARTVHVDRAPSEGVGSVLVVCAGTSDLPVAEEARITASLMGARTELIADVGVAGLHRILSHTDRLSRAKAVVVVAGMEGALPSVVGGLVDCPVIACPTSVGYGAAFGGVAALLGMLNTCASGVTVVNIDNGFGAGYAAATINRLAAETPQ